MIGYLKRKKVVSFFWGEGGGGREREKINFEKGDCLYNQCNTSSRPSMHHMATEAKVKRRAFYEYACAQAQSVDVA